MNSLTNRKTFTTNKRILKSILIIVLVSLTLALFASCKDVSEQKEEQRDEEEVKEKTYTWSDPVKGDAYTLGVQDYGEESFGDYYKVEPVDNKEEINLRFLGNQFPSGFNKIMTPSSPKEDGLLGSSESLPTWYEVKLEATDDEMKLTCSVEGIRKAIVSFTKIWN